MYIKQNSQSKFRSETIIVLKLNIPFLILVTLENVGIIVLGVHPETCLKGPDFCRANAQPF